jgi:predicted metalloprotease
VNCPKCGSETGDYQRHLFGTNGGGAWCYKCNEYVHIQVRFTKCDHEEKVGGEKDEE